MQQQTAGANKIEVSDDLRKLAKKQIVNNKQGECRGRKNNASDVMHMQTSVPQKMAKARLLLNYQLSSTNLETNGASHHDNEKGKSETNSVPLASNLTPL